MRSRVGLLAITIGGYFASAVASAASFDCTKATSPIDKAICSSVAVSGLDTELAAVYSGALKAAEDPENVRRGQRSWIKDVRNNCTDEACLISAYHTRIGALSTPSGKAPSPPPSQGSASAPAAVTTAAVAPIPPVASVAAPKPAASNDSSPAKSKVAEAETTACVDRRPLLSEILCSYPAIQTLEAEQRQLQLRALGTGDKKTRQGDQNYFDGLHESLSRCDNANCVADLYLAYNGVVRASLQRRNVNTVDIAQVVLNADEIRQVLDRRQLESKAGRPLAVPTVSPPGRQEQTVPPEPAASRPILGIGAGMPVCAGNALPGKRCVQVENADRLWELIAPVSYAGSDNSRLFIELRAVENMSNTPVPALRIVCFGSNDVDDRGPRIAPREFDVVFGPNEANLLRKYSIKNFKSHHSILGVPKGQENAIPVSGTPWGEARSVRCRTLYAVIPSIEEWGRVRAALKALSDANGPAPVDTSDPVGELRAKFATMGPRCPSNVKQQTLEALAKIRELQKVGAEASAMNLARQQKMILESAGCIAR